MILYLNCDKDPLNKSFTKADYLLRATNKYGVTVQMYTPSIQPDYVLNIEPFHHFVQGTKWTGVWEIDVLCDRREMSDSNWAVSDSVFVAVSTIPSRLNNMAHKAQLLFQAIDPTIHKRIDSIQQTYDYVLCGSNGLAIYHKRDKAFKLLSQNFNYIDYKKGFSPEEYIKKLNTAKVQFIRSMNTPIGDGELAQRFFECLAIGPVLTNDCFDLQFTDLVEGVDYMSYKDDREMLAKMKLLVEDATLRNSIAENGRKKGLLFHTYSNRLNTIIEEFI